MQVSNFQGFPDFSGLNEHLSVWEKTKTTPSQNSQTFHFDEVWMITAGFTNPMTSFSTDLELFPSSSQPDNLQVPTGMTGESSLQPLGLWLKAPGWNFPGSHQKYFKRYINGAHLWLLQAEAEQDAFQTAYV